MEKNSLFYSIFLKNFFVLNNDLGDEYPLSLTINGKIIHRDSKGHDFIKLYKTELIEKIKSLNPQTSYDVQTYAVDVLKEVSNDDSFNSIKTYAFKNGMDLDFIIRIMSIPLRDLAINEFISRSIK